MCFLQVMSLSETQEGSAIKTFQGPVMLNFKSYRILWGSGEEKQKVSSSREEGDVGLG